MLKYMVSVGALASLLRISYFLLSGKHQLPLMSLFDVSLHLHITGSYVDDFARWHWLLRCILIDQLALHVRREGSPQIRKIGLLCNSSSHDSVSNDARGITLYPLSENLSFLLQGGIVRPC